MLSALVLGFPDPLSMGLASGWLMAGCQIKGIWFPRRAISSSQFERDRGWARTAPGISMHGICERAGLRPRAVPPLAVWHEAVDEMKALAPDVVLSLMFTDRIPRLVLTAFPGRVLNLHPSMLPAYRGANPIFNMLWDRSIDRYSGVSLHLVDENFDSGPLLAQSAVPFPQTRRLGSYFMELVKAGSPLLVGAVADYLAGRLQAVEQQRGVWPQSIHKPGHAKLSRNMTAMEVEWLSSTIPQMAPLRIEGQPEALLVAGFEQILGPPTGAPISTDRDHIEIDFVDRRIRLRRLNS